MFHTYLPCICLWNFHKLISLSVIITGGLGCKTVWLPRAPTSSLSSSVTSWMLLMWTCAVFLSHFLHAANVNLCHNAAAAASCAAAAGCAAEHFSQFAAFSCFTLNFAFLHFAFSAPPFSLHFLLMLFIFFCTSASPQLPRMLHCLLCRYYYFFSFFSFFFFSFFFSIGWGARALPAGIQLKDALSPPTGLECETED